MSTVVATNEFNGLLSTEALTLGGCLVLFSAGFSWLFNTIRKSEFIFKISPATKDTIKKSVGWAAASWGIGFVSVLGVRAAGWKRVAGFYQKIYSNPYSALLSWAVPPTLAAGTLMCSKKQPAAKRGLLVGTSLATGALVAPVFFTKRDLVTIAGGYTAGLVVPLAAAATFSPNFFVLNLASVIGMGVGTIFMNTTGLPWILQRRHRHQPSYTSRWLNTGVSNLLLSSVVTAAFFLLTTVNAHVLYIEKAHRAKQEEASSGKRKFSLTGLLFDGTDEIANGLVMAGYTGFTLYRLLMSAVRVAKRVAGMAKKEEKESDLGLLGDLLKM